MKTYIFSAFTVSCILCRANFSTTEILSRKEIIVIYFLHKSVQTFNDKTT